MSVRRWSNGRRYISAADWAAVRARQALDAALMVSEANLMPADRRNRLLYQSAFASSEGLTAYADAIPPEDELEEPVEFPSSSNNTFDSELRRRARLTVLAFRTGVAVSADLWLGGLDTPATHDPDQGWLLGNLTDGAEYLGIENWPGAQRFPFNNTEDLAFFG